MSKLPVIAAFDFDRTITYQDRLLPFLFFTHGYFKAVVNLMMCLPILIGYLFGFRSRQQTKERILEKFYKGRLLTDLQLEGKKYVEQGIKVKPEALQRITWHKQQGHRCVIVSAGIDVFLDPWAKTMDIPDVLCSKLASDEKGKVTGKLVGLNCRASEKVNRLNQLLGPKEGYILYAYGDSKGDKEMLELADYPYYRKFTP